MSGTQRPRAANVSDEARLSRSLSVSCWFGRHDERVMQPRHDCAPSTDAVIPCFIERLRKNPGERGLAPPGDA
jgi:hypothetical protein